MRWLLLFLLLIPNIATAGGGMWGSPKAYSGSSASQLYQDATAIWDFDNDDNDTKGTHDLTPVNAPTYGNATPSAPVGGVGTYYVKFDLASSQAFTHAYHADFNIGDGVDYAVFYRVYFTTSVKIAPAFITATGNTNGLQIVWAAPVDYEPIVNHYVGGGGSSSDPNGATPAINTWYDVATSYNSTTNVLSMWMTTNGGTFDDEITTNNTTMGNDPASMSNPLDIGRIGSTYRTFYLKELVFWKGRTLSAAEAEDITNGDWR